MAQRIRSLCFLGAVFVAGGADAGTISAPVLKWAYGGCQPGDCQTGWYAGPAVVQLDGDPQLEVVYGSYDVVAIDAVTQAVQWRGTNAQRVWPAPAIADLDGNGSLEIVVGRGGDQLTVYDALGNVVWTRNPFTAGEVRTLAVEDLETDGDLEIVVGCAAGPSGQMGSRQVSVYEHTGSVRSGWPARRMGEPGFGAWMYNENVAVADMDGNGFKEIFAPTDTHYITALARNGDQLFVNPIYGTNETWAQNGVHVDHAADLRGFANCGSEDRPNFADAAPAIADLDGNGTLELVVPGDVYDCSIGDPAGDLHYLPWILRLDRTRWSNATYDWLVLPTPEPNSGPLAQDFNLIQSSVSNAVLADLDGDGEREIVFPTYDGRMHAWWLDKTEHGVWPYDVPGSGIRFAAEPAIVDLDGDGYAEVLFTSWPENGGNRRGQLHVLDHTGASLFAIDLPAPRGDDWNGGLAAPTVANIDGDADLELVVGTWASGAVAYDLPGSANARVLWGTARGSQRRTGLAPAAPPGPVLFRSGFE